MLSPSDTILVTGGHGFLGRHLCAALRSRGIEPTAPNSSAYDLTDRDDVRRMFADTNPDVIFHLAARCGGIGANRESPGDFISENLLMNTHLLDGTIWHSDVRKIVLVGSVCMYPKHAPVPFCEDDLWNGYPEETNAPYGIAKRALLVQAQAYRQQYGLNAIMLLPVNLYGPGDNFDLDTSHVIPAIIRKIDDAQRRGSKVVVLWGDGTPTREFLYAGDCAEALVLAAERYDGVDPVNVGTGREISIADLAALIARIMDYDGTFMWNGQKPNGQPRRRLDVSRAREWFGFEARTDLEDGLRRTVEWWRQNREQS